VSSPSAELRELGAWGQAVTLAFRFLLVAAALIPAGWLVSNFHQIPPDSQAVVLRFGSAARVHGPGLLLAWPRPIEKVALLPASARQIQLKIRRYAGRASDSNSDARGMDIDSDQRFNGAFLTTGDSGVVHLEARLFYQIQDPVAYMVSEEHIEPALERLFVAAAVVIVGSRDLDSILVARPEVASEAVEVAHRERLRSDLLAAVNRRLEILARQGASLGIIVSRVDLVPSIPAGAKEAFDNVLRVTQEVEANVANARTNAQLTSQEANRNKDRVAANATAAAEELISSARGRTASIKALAEQSRDMSRNMQLTRIYYDRIGVVLKRARRVDVVDGNGSVRTILPGGAP
jgi:regulator of protease activity HflC (stomatin/prohibitin superfamily)